MASRISRSDHLFQQISTNWIRSERKMNDSADLDTAFFEMLEDVNRNHQEERQNSLAAPYEIAGKKAEGNMEDERTGSYGLQL